LIVSSFVVFVVFVIYFRACGDSMALVDNLFSTLAPLGIYASSRHVDGENRLPSTGVWI
jgi:hypothetical protein